MSDPLASVSPGQVSPLLVSTASVNAVMEAARAFRAAKGAGFARRSEAAPVVPAAEVYVRNDTGGSLPEFSVVALGTPVISASTYPLRLRRSPVFGGTAPAAATDAFAITLEPAGVSGIVTAAVLGVVVCDLSVSDAGHGYAQPTAATTATLESAESGPAKIIWKASGTGTKRAVVLLTGAWGSRPAAGCGLVYDEEYDEYAVDMEVDAGQTVTLNVDTHTVTGPTIASGGVLTLPYERRELAVTFNACGMPIGFAVGEPEEREETVDVCDAGCHDSVSYGSSVIPCTAESTVVVTGGEHEFEAHTSRVVVTGGEHEFEAHTSRVVVTGGGEIDFTDEE